MSGKAKTGVAQVWCLAGAWAGIPVYAVWAAMDEAGWDRAGAALRMAHWVTGVTSLAAAGCWLFIAWTVMLGVFRWADRQNRTVHDKQGGGTPK